MSISKRAPNTIHLGGPITQINDLVAIEAITPGMLVEYEDDSGTLKWAKHDSADEPVCHVALEQIELNKTIDDAYAAGDLVRVAALGKGAQFYGLIGSGQNITQGAFLQSAGNGKLKAYTSGAQGCFVAVSSPGAVLEDTRIRVEVLV